MSLSDRDAVAMPILAFGSQDQEAAPPSGSGEAVAVLVDNS